MDILNQLIHVKHQMPLVLGSICTDGAVLIGDSQSIIVDVTTSQKRSNSLSIPGALILGTYRNTNGYDSREESFFTKSRVRNVESKQDNLSKGTRVQKLTERTRLNIDRSNVTELLVITGSSRYGQFELQYIDTHMAMSRIVGCRGIGDGVAYIFPFLERYCTNALDVKRFIELGYFMIRFIENYYIAKKSTQSTYPTVLYLLNDENVVKSPSNSDHLTLTDLTANRLVAYKKSFFTSLDLIFSPVI